MKRIPLLLASLLMIQGSAFLNKVNAQAFPELTELKGTAHQVFYSAGAKDRAEKLSQRISAVTQYYSEILQFTPAVKLLVLSPEHWDKYARNVVYGMPHYRNDEVLVVASENNPFWQSFIPPLDKIPTGQAEKIRDVYSLADGSISMEKFFDLLAIHELGHAYHFQQKVNMQRKWMSELFVNIFLHAYIAEKEPMQLPALTTFPQMVVKLTDPSSLKYTSLQDVHSLYDSIAMKYPQNYGWYQCRWHSAAAELYNKEGMKPLLNLWTTLKVNPQNLNDAELTALVKSKVSAVLADVITNWDK